jgi:hypothetical protein
MFQATRTLFAALLIVSVSSMLLADDPGPDFDIQGEYVGEVEAENGVETYGAQVIALGGGKFRVVGYPGGLPGAGWVGGDEKRLGEGACENGVVKFYVEDAVATLKDGAVTVVHDGRELGKLKKVVRKSPTLGAEPPEGAIVLFDGSSADAFQNGKLVDGEYLGATSCVSKQKFQDHSLHIEFCTPFMPDKSGQKRGNSGVYVQSRYEVQVLDSFGLEGKDNECGGIYKVSEPAVNMCFPPLSWQTYDIDFTAARYDDAGNKTKNARITVKHNGVVIHDDIELPQHTPGRQEEAPTPAGLFLQDHNDPVLFRNIWVVEK